MKKLLFLLLVLMASHGAWAQETQFGVKMGVNFPSLQPRTGFSPGSEYKISAKFLLGGFANIKIGTATTLQPGLLFSVKGNKSVEQHNTISFGSPVPYTTERNLNIYYFELPVNVLYNKTLSLGTAYAGGGAYAAYAVSARIRSINKRNTYMKRGSAERVAFGDQPDQLDKFDYGLNAVAGFRLKNKIDFSLNYGFGLANISNNPGFKSQNRNVNLSIGYIF
ncbi:outer membrane beta-barrel protein [Pedobacter sp. KR3-3]|uniref:Outer membrane beta-barrel protein n=1 Tax=Pedobacter albus TaxID=3113905 RepID=A0ABU7I7S1_9SPHI|nr:outer membrane beta-barrel protein [Pedobacter sp. KR3-3]MEE1945279.1 outer membrane beta-barrel protein [Pedobacter sp. KR3-3]